MIPESVEPDLAPGGVVALAFDLDDNEIVRSLVTESRANLTDFMAGDAGAEVARRGGGRMVMYDGDTGEKVITGPKVAIDPDGYRLSMTHNVNDLADLVPLVLDDSGHWPWQVIGVFPTAGTEMPYEWWNYFCYTVGFGNGCELWAPTASIEGRAGDPELITMVLNRIAAGCAMGWVNPGDTVIVPLGIADFPEEGDVDTIWWIGWLEDNDHRRGVYQSPARFVLPILWSSPLGFENVTKGGRVLTDADLDELAEEAEQGYDTTHLRKEPDG